MLGKILSQDFNYKFEVIFDKDKQTQLQKIKRWIAKKQPPLRIVLEHLFSFVEKWYWEGKELQTKHQIEQQVKYMGDIWDKEDEQRANKAEILETGLFGEEGWSVSISNPVVERRSEETNGCVGVGCDEIRLGEKLPDPWSGDWNDYWANSINKSE